MWRQPTSRWRQPTSRWQTPGAARARSSHLHRALQRVLQPGSADRHGPGFATPAPLELEVNRSPPVVRAAVENLLPPGPPRLLHCTDPDGVEHSLVATALATPRLLFRVPEWQRETVRALAGHAALSWRVGAPAPAFLTAVADAPAVDPMTERFVQAVLGTSVPEPAGRPPPTASTNPPVSPALSADPAQARAVATAVSQPLTLVRGRHGSGLTHTAVLLAHTLAPHTPVVVATASRATAETLAGRLAAAGVDAVAVADALAETLLLRRGLDGHPSFLHRRVVLRLSAPDQRRLAAALASPTPHIPPDLATPVSQHAAHLLTHAAVTVVPCRLAHRLVSPVLGMDLAPGGVLVVDDADRCSDLHHLALLQLRRFAHVVLLAHTVPPRGAWVAHAARHHPLHLTAQHRPPSHPVLMWDCDGSTVPVENHGRVLAANLPEALRVVQCVATMLRTPVAPEHMAVVTATPAQALLVARLLARQQVLPGETVANRVLGTSSVGGLTVGTAAALASAEFRLVVVLCVVDAASDTAAMPLFAHTALSRAPAAVVVGNRSVLHRLPAWRQLIDAWELRGRVLPATRVFAYM